MKSHHELAGVVVNIILALLILAFIVIGLNKIGIYDLPDEIERILGTGDGSDYAESSDGSINIDHVPMHFDESVSETVVDDLTYENAATVIEGIDYNKNYNHRINIGHYTDLGIFLESAVVTCNNGLYSASLFDSDGVLIRQIIEFDDHVDITTIYDGESVITTVPKGGFDISDECGFVVTARDFIDSGVNLVQADFELFYDNFGSQIRVTFDNSIDGYTQREIYTVSLDFGVITSVESYFDGKLVYSMTTESLTNQM